jgi:hypothetical protein
MEPIQILEAIKEDVHDKFDGDPLMMRTMNLVITEYKARSERLHKPIVSSSLLVSELEKFYYEMGEDWHLWDEQEQGQYPVQRVFDAMKNFVDYHKSNNDR